MGVRDRANITWAVALQELAGFDGGCGGGSRMPGTRSVWKERGCGRGISVGGHAWMLDVFKKKTMKRIKVLDDHAR